MLHYDHLYKKLRIEFLLIQNHQHLLHMRHTFPMYIISQIRAIKFRLALIIFLYFKISKRMRWHQKFSPGQPYLTVSSPVSSQLFLQLFLITTPQDILGFPAKKISNKFSNNVPSNCHRLHLFCSFASFSIALLTFSINKQNFPEIS